MTRSREVASIVGAVTAAVLWAAPAQAQPSADTDVTILDARKGSCEDDGFATWTVEPRITIRNTSEDDDVVTRVDYSSRYKVGGGTQATSGAQATDDGGLAPGVVIAPHESETFSPVVETSISCDATAATLFVSYELRDGHKVFTGGADYVSDGTAVPAGTLGLLLATAGAGGLLAFTMTRRRPPSSTSAAAGR